MASWVIANGVNPGLMQGKPNETASFPVAVPVASQHRRENTILSKAATYTVLYFTPRLQCSQYSTSVPVHNAHESCT